jgi:transcriptional regulator with XRE-family HTH domain
MVKHNSGNALKITSQPKPEYKNADRRKLLGRNIYIALVLKEMNRTDLAKLLEVSLAAVSAWTKGTRIPDIFQLKDIADITGQTVDWFYEEHK